MRPSARLVALVSLAAAGACTQDAVSPRADGSAGLWLSAFTNPPTVSRPLDAMPEMAAYVRDVVIPEGSWPRELSDEELVASTAQSEGLVHIGLRPPSAAPTRLSGVVPGMDRASALELREELQRQGVEIVQTFRNSAAVVGRIDPRVAPTIRRLAFVNYVAPDGRGRVGQSPPPQEIGWQVTQVGAPWVWANLSDFGQWATVTLLDTGIDSVHRWNGSLDGPENVFVDCLYVPSVASTCYQGANVHGSHVAGIASARNNDYGIVGIAWSPANFATVRVCRDDGVCTDAALASGLDWTISNGYSRQIVNISLQFCASNPTVASLIAQSAGSGNLLVSIAGNTDYDCSGNPAVGATGVTYPGRYPQVLTVSGTLPNDVFADPGVTPTCSRGSRYGNEVDLSAPFWSKSMVANGQWAVFCGTSMAAPVVTAVAAMVWSRYTSMTASQVQGRLEAFAVDPGPTGWDNRFGHGRVSAFNALYVPPPPPPALTVSISGPSTVRPDDVCTWVGGVSGGTPPYTLEWLVNGSLAQQGGEYFAWSSSSSFSITVNAWDSGSLAGGNSVSINVDPNAGQCNIQ